MTSDERKMLLDELRREVDDGRAAAILRRLLATLPSAEWAAANCPPWTEKQRAMKRKYLEKKAAAQRGNQAERGGSEEVGGASRRRTAEADGAEERVIELF